MCTIIGNDVDKEQMLKWTYKLDNFIVLAEQSCMKNKMSYMTEKVVCEEEKKSKTSYNRTIARLEKTLKFKSHSILLHLFISLLSQ